jgi:hypothetical protein
MSPKRLICFEVMEFKLHEIELFNSTSSYGNEHCVIITVLIMLF